MNLFKLLPTTYQPGDTIKGFESLIWTERYNEPGDVTLVFKNDLRVLTGLPKGSLISHTDTLQVMMIEDHRIVRDEDDELTITVTGRSIDSFMEFRGTRWTLAGLTNLFTGEDFNEYYEEKPEILAIFLIDQCLISGAGSSGGDSGDYIPNSEVIDAIRFTSGFAEMTLIRRGTLDSMVRSLLNYVGGGLKVSRPNVAHTTLRWAVHDGRDLSLANTEARDQVTLVTFSAAYKDLKSAEYFTSIRDYYNYAHAAGKTSARAVVLKDLTPIPTGFDRRTGVLEDPTITGSTPSRLESPGFSPTNPFETSGQRFLKNHGPISILSAVVSETARPKYKINYDIGDIVNVAGEFGISSAMRVTEHVLVLDSEGLRGYPSLTNL